MGEDDDRATQALDDAVQAAAFYGGLIANGVPLQQAAAITGQYVQTLVLARLGGAGPSENEPWQQ